jgi:Uma2 family endonuclease
MAEAIVVAPREDRTLFSLHPEDEMTEHAFHDRQLEYLKFALGQSLPDWFLARNMAVYWVPGQREHPYVGPDLFIARGRPADENPSCYLTYEDGPLTFVVEVASESTRAGESRKRDAIYAAELGVPEHLYIDGERHVLVLSRLVEGRYEAMAPDEAGRYWSRGLGIGFAWQEDGRLVRVMTASGEIVPTAAEEAALRREAEERAQREARRAQRDAQRAEREARRARQEAGRADEEARLRAEAEARAEALAAELERLRRSIQGEPDVPPRAGA